MKKSGGWILATLLLPAALTSLCSGARADTWEAYSNAKWGFKMLIVSSMSLDEYVSVQGWTGCRATQAPVVILALTKVDTFLSEGDLKAAASGLTSAPATIRWRRSSMVSRSTVMSSLGIPGISPIRNTISTTFKAG